ncbi:hypothetical protein [Mariniluteicoccus flavus]
MTQIHAPTAKEPRVEPRPPEGIGAFGAFHFALGLIVVLWLNSGTAEIVLGNIAGIYKWLGAAAWLGLSLFERRHSARLVSTGWPLAAFLLYAALVLDRSGGAERAMLQNFAYLVVAFALYSFYSRHAVPAYRAIIVGIVILDMIVVGVRTWLELNINPEVSRYLATGGAYEDVAAATEGLWGIGGYAYAYAMPPLLLVFLFHALTRQRFRRAAWVAVVVGTALLIKMAFTIAVLLWVACAGLLILRHLVGRERRALAYLCVAISLGMAWLIAPALLAELGSSDLLPDVLTVRLNEVADWLAGSHSDNSDLGARADRYLSSLAVFAEHWLGGVSVTGRGVEEIGGHSAWLDGLAVFGISFLLLCGFLWSVWRDQKDAVGAEAAPVLNIVWGYFGVLGMVNTIFFAHIILVWMVIVPFFLAGSEASRRKQAG